MTQQSLSAMPEKTKERVIRREAEPNASLLFRARSSPIHDLQQKLGNRQVTRLIQAKRLTPDGKIIGLQRKLTVGAADDPYEQEADRVARQVMNTPDAAIAPSVQRTPLSGVKNQALPANPPASSIASIVLRQSEKDSEEDKDGDEEKNETLLQARSLMDRSVLPLSWPGDSDDKEQPIQSKSAHSMAGSFDAGADVETQISLSKGRGSPLPDPVRRFMEPRFGVDFSQVRVHTGSEAQQMNQAVGAQAFTHGSDIYFGESRSPSHLELTAHELTHVVQQTGSRPPLLTAKHEEQIIPPSPDELSIQRICATCAENAREAGDSANTPVVQRQLEKNEKIEDQSATIQAKFINGARTGFLQRQAENEAEEKKSIQAASIGSVAGSLETGDELESKLVQAKSQGSPLADTARSLMKVQFDRGFDLTTISRRASKPSDSNPTSQTGPSAASQSNSSASSGPAQSSTSTNTPVTASNSPRESGAISATTSSAPSARQHPPESTMTEQPIPAGNGGASGGSPELLMPEPPSDISPMDRARLEQVQNNAGEAAATHTDLPPAETIVTEARGAVEEPEAETHARAEGDLVTALDQRQPPSPEIEELCERIREVIRSKRPPDEDSLVDADPEAMARQSGGQLNSAIEGDTNRVQASYNQLQSTPQGQPAQQPQEINSPPASVEAPPVNAQAAVPAPVSAENVSLDADVQANQQRMDEAGMNSESAQLVRTGPIAEARAAQGELAGMAERDPAEVLAEQEAARDRAGTDMAALEQRALAALATARTTTVNQTGAGQQNMVGTEEQMRVRVGAEAQRIFQTAQSQVNNLLEPLSRTAMSQWETGVAVLSERFKQRLHRVKSWIDERHSGVGGAIVGAIDYIAGLPDWVTEEYDAAERDFGDGVCDLIRDISSHVNGVIATCEGLIEDARNDISELFNSLPAELQEWAEGEQARFGEQLDGLHNQATQTRDRFNQDLAHRASQSVQEVRQQIHTLREAAGGLVGRIVNAVDRFLEDPVKFIIEGLLELVGIPPAAFWALVNRIQQVISDIADDPLGFANNLVNALGQGFQKFFDNFGQHILGGFFDWLFSGLGAVGVQIPADFSLGSIVTFFLQLMGITWARIRQILARHIGEENVALLEKAYELISTLMERGVDGIFELIKEQLNPQTLIDAVLRAAVDFLMDALIRAVTPRIIALFNPAGAIVQAIEVIYRVLSWIFQNAARIFSLIETVVNGAADLIAGNIGGMATAVEGALARLIAPVIDFLAGFLGLGDLPDRIADTIRGFQEMVLGIIDRVVGWLAERARGLLRALGIGGAEHDTEGQESSGGIHVTEDTSMSGEGHHLIVDAGDRGLEVKMASQYLQALSGVTYTAIRKEREGQNRSDLISDLDAITVQLKEMEEWWSAREHQEQPVEVIKTWINARLDHLAGQLQAIGNKYKITDLINLGHPSRYVVGNQLKEDYCGGGNTCPSRIIRPLFYRGFNSSTITWKRQELIANNRANNCPPGLFKDPINGRLYAYEDAEIDHYNPTVVEHWNNSGGNNSVQSARQGYYNNQSALRILSDEENQRLGREETDRYTRTVGPEFRGPED